MTSGTEPLEFGRTILHRASGCAQKKVTRHRRGAWLRQKKNASTRLLSQISLRTGGAAEVTSNVEKKICDARLCRNLRSAAQAF